MTIWTPILESQGEFVWVRGAGMSAKAIISPTQPPDTEEGKDSWYRVSSQLDMREWVPVQTASKEFLHNVLARQKGS